VENGVLITVSAPRKGLEINHIGGVSIELADKEMLSATTPKNIVSKMKGESLNVIIHT
jgi:hypothetical protein